MEQNKQPNLIKKTTKISLVVYFSLIAILAIVFIICSAVKKDWSLTWGYLLCLGPCISFVLISIFVPIEKVIQYKNKRLIVIPIILYVIKYFLIIGIPILGILINRNSYLFNRWVMLATTLIAPATVLIIKIIFANIVSKFAKKDEKTSTNSIKFD